MYYKLHYLLITTHYIIIYLIEALLNMFLMTPIISNKTQSATIYYYAIPYNMIYLLLIGLPRFSTCNLNYTPFVHHSSDSSRFYTTRIINVTIT